MASYQISRVGTTKDQLGEGLLWDPISEQLFWTDALGRVLHRLDVTNGERRDFDLPGDIGAFALRENGGGIISLNDGFYFIDLSNGKVELAGDILNDNPNLRFNDGTVDRQGRFLSGMMHVRSAAADPKIGELWRRDGDGNSEQIETGLAVFNGPCFSLDGTKFYFTDSPKKIINVCDYDIETGCFSNRSVFVDLTDRNTHADGATIDSEGYLWTALIGTSQVARFDPDGKLVVLIDMPMRYPSNVAFGGNNLDVLFVTSIWKTPNIIDEGEGAGGLFQIEGLGVTGLVEPRFAG